MSSTYCHRCGRMMASGLPLCPHCGTLQDEESRAKSRRQNHTIWLAIGIGAVLGMAGGWLMLRNTEGLVGGLIFGVLVGRVLVAAWHGW